MPQEIRTVAIVGCGVIGMGWAVLFLSRGLKVIISDPAEGARDALKQYLDQAKPFFEGCGNFEQLATNYEFVCDIVPRLAEVDYVQEVNLSSTDVSENVYTIRNRAVNLTISYRTDQNAQSSRQDSWRRWMSTLDQVL